LGIVMAPECDPDLARVHVRESRDAECQIMIASDIVACEDADGHAARVIGRLPE
jgi:hypothetical protein